MDKKSCFIIMPFSKAKFRDTELDETTLNYIYEHVIKKAIEEYRIEDKPVFSEIARYNSKVGSIVSGIAVNLNKSDLVIADLTGLNPNVMYELGVRHTLRRGTIVISQDVSALPSDLRDYMCIQYNFSTNTIQQPENYNKFKSDLHNSITELFSTDKYDSPVLNYLNGKEKYWKEDELKALKENIVISNYIFEQYTLIQKEIERLQQNPDPEDILKRLTPIINNLASSISDINISVQSAILYENILAAASLISDVSKKFILPDYFGSLGDYLPIPAGENPFRGNHPPIFESHFLDYFKLTIGEYEQISFLEVFSNEHSFYLEFISELEDYLEGKIKELGLTEEEIDYILVN